MRDNTIVLVNSVGCFVDVEVEDIKLVVRSPKTDLFLCADRYQMHNGDIYWTKGYRGWYDEHKLQKGLVIQQYKERNKP